MSNKKTATLKKELAADMFDILLALNRAYYTTEDMDEIAKVAARSLAIVRRIDMHPHLEHKFQNKQQ